MQDELGTPGVRNYHSCRKEESWGSNVGWDEKEFQERPEVGSENKQAAQASRPSEITMPWLPIAFYSAPGNFHHGGRLPASWQPIITAPPRNILSTSRITPLPKAIFGLFWGYFCRVGSLSRLSHQQSPLSRIMQWQNVIRNSFILSQNRVAGLIVTTGIQVQNGYSLVELIITQKQGRKMNNNKNRK